MCPDPHQNHGRGWRRETGLSPPMKYFTDRSKAVIIFCGSVVLCKSCVCHAFVSVTCWERADLLARACDVKLCFYHFPNVVSWVRCGTSLYRFLIFAALLTLFGCARFFKFVYTMEVKRLKCVMLGACTVTEKVQQRRWQLGYSEDNLSS